MFFLIATALLALVSAYSGARLLPALPLSPLGLALGAVVLSVPVLLAAGALIAQAACRQRLARRFIWAVSLTLGWVSWLLVVTLLRELLLAAVRWWLGTEALQRLLEDSAFAAVASAVLATLLGICMALRPPRVREVPVPLVGLPGELAGFTLVQISDLHISRTISRRRVQRLVARINALRPDLIVITGDLIDGNVDELADRVAPLAQLRARHGCYFVTGNHEYYSGVSAWLDVLRGLGMRVLLNEHALVQHGGATLLLAGVTDTSAHQFDPRQRSDPEAAARGAPAAAQPRILLAHRPASAPAAARAGFDLQLSGHTHGGQFWPWNWIVAWREPLSIGLDRLEKLWVYTSRGTGFWGPPDRLGVPAEISRISLVCADC